jgi:hypothetical protein
MKYSVRTEDLTKIDDDIVGGNQTIDWKALIGTSGKLAYDYSDIPFVFSNMRAAFAPLMNKLKELKFPAYLALPPAADDILPLTAALELIASAGEKTIMPNDVSGTKKQAYFFWCIVL